MLLSRCRGALTFSSLPTCIGALELEGTTVTSPLHSVPRHIGCVVRQRLLPRVLSTTDVESCEPQRSPLGCRGGERCLLVVAPTTDHIRSCLSTPQAGALDLFT